MGDKHVRLLMERGANRKLHLQAGMPSGGRGSRAGREAQLVTIVRVEAWMPRTAQGVKE